MDSFYLKGVFLGTSTFFLGIFMDIILDNNTRKQLKKQHYFLYYQMYKMSFINLIIVSPLYFSLIKPFVKDIAYLSICEIISIILFHNILYWVIHYGMHTIHFLKPIHRFHHYYKNNIVPSVGNAVTIQEMLLAYLTPFYTYAVFFYPTINSLIIGISLISVFNLIVHSNYLTRCKWYRGFVSPKMHIRHHNIYLKHFSAPILDFDSLYNYISSGIS